MSDSIATQKDIFGKIQGLLAFLDTTDEKKNRENLEAWKNNNTKILWIIVSVGLGLVITTSWQALF